MKKRIAVIAGTMVVLGAIAVAAYAAYDIAGSSGAEGFPTGTAADLAVDPQSEDLNYILPGDTKRMDVLITNNTSGPATVTGLTATFNDGGACALTVAQVSGYPYGIGGGASIWDAVNVTMGNAAPGCEGGSLTVTATATGSLP